MLRQAANLCSCPRASANQKNIIVTSAAHRSKTSLSKSHRHSQTTCNSHVSPPPSFIRRKKSNSMPARPEQVFNHKTSGSVSNPVFQKKKKQSSERSCNKVVAGGSNQYGPQSQKWSDSCSTRWVIRLRMRATLPKYFSGSLGTAPRRTRRRWW